MNEEGWIEKEFPVKKQYIYCNNAAVAPLPSSTARFLQSWLQDYTDKGSINYSQWLDSIALTRNEFALFLNCHSSEIAFVKNTSTGLSFLANGFPFTKEDEVVVFENEFPSNLYPWLYLRKKGITIKVVPERNYQYDYEEWLSMLNPRTKLCSVSFIEYSTGFKHDLKYLGKECRKRGIIFAVDAIQGLGVFPLDVQQCNIDFLCADGHKWLLAPEGCAVMYVNKSLISLLEPVTLGWHSVCHDSDYEKIQLDLKPDARRFEEGSPNVFGILALQSSLSIIKKYGLQRIASRVGSLTSYLKENISTDKYHLLSLQKEPSCIVSFKPAAGDTGALFEKLKNNNIFAAVRRGGIRLSPHFYNDENEMQCIVKVFNSC